MATYACNTCGMTVDANCGKCHEPLVHGQISTQSGERVQVSKCPNDHGKIKSPQCCGQDMDTN